MAKSKRKSAVARKVEPATKATSNSDVLVVDMQTLLVPVSILFAGLMVALALFFGLRGSSPSLGLGNNPGNGTDNTEEEPTGIREISQDLSIDGDPYKGDKGKAKFAIVEFTDYECPYCKQHYQQTYSQLISSYVDTGDAVYVVKDFPLSFHDPLATNLAIASQCVFDQGGNSMFFGFHDKVFETTTSNGNGMTEDQIKSAVTSVGANLSSFNTCYDSREFADEVAEDMNHGIAVGVQGTPGFIIGKLSDDGKSVVESTLIPGAYPLSDFQVVLNGLLEK